MLARSSEKYELNVLVSFSDSVVVNDEDGIVLGDRPNLSRSDRIQSKLVTLLLVLKKSDECRLTLSVVRTMYVIKHCPVSSMRSPMLVCLVVLHGKQSCKH